VIDNALDLLLNGEIEILARFTNSSNTTLLVDVAYGTLSAQAVYKPESGERPLWDFPEGLWRREVAAYLLDDALGLGLIPPTIGRQDLPLGPGSLQLFVDEDEQAHYFTLREELRYTETLKRLAAFDVIANNSDRKSGHVLLTPDGIAAIDHGLCFHQEDKLRTVIWDYAGDSFDPEFLTTLENISRNLPRELEQLLSPAEIGCLVSRITDLVEAGELPYPNEDGPYPPYPWPLI
jgi:hypothetical protein